MLAALLAEADKLDHLLTSDYVPGFFKDMNAGQRLALLLPAAYFLGSVPFGMVVGRMKGIDITKHGSGNIGATNVGRLLGRKYFYLVFFLDMFKGLLPMLAAYFLLSDVVRLPSGYFAPSIYILWLLIGFAAIAGHMFSVFMKFKGGKGIATTLGVILGLFPYFTLPAMGVLVVWVVVFAASRYVSLASILASVSFPGWYLAIGNWRKWPILTEQLSMTVFAFVVAGLIVYKHRANIRRLMDGREPHYHPGSHKSAGSSSSSSSPYSP